MCVCVCVCVCLTVLVQGASGLEHRLVHIPTPILKVPNICIHLNREMNKSFGPNPETQMCVWVVVGWWGLGKKGDTWD